MDLSIQKRIEIYDQSSEVIKHLYGGTEVAEAVKLAVSKAAIDTEPDYGIFVLTLGDIILGLYKKDHLKRLLQDRTNLTETQINTAVSSLKDFLEKIPQSERSDNTVLDPIIETGVQLEKTDLSTESTGVKPLRTFADDINISRAHGYGAFRSGEKTEKNPDEESIHRSRQDDIIKE